MKKILRFIGSILIVISLSGCSIEYRTNYKDNNLNVDTYANTEEKDDKENFHESEKEIKKREKLNWIVVDKILLGGTLKDEWISVEKMDDQVNGGENYSLYQFAPNKKLGEAKGSKIELWEPSLTQSIEIETDKEFDMALTGKWNTTPRDIIIQNIKNTKYKKIVKKILVDYGLKEVDVNILQNYRVDMDGDGTDEVIINASNLDYDNPIPPMHKGDYSFIIFRKIVDGEVKNIVLYKSIGLTNPDWAKTGTYDLQLIGNIEGIFDLNGDGKMEIIIGSRYYEGFGYEVYEIKDNTPSKVIYNGWGV